MKPYIFSEEIDRKIDTAGGWIMALGAIYFAGQILRMIFS